MGRGEVASIAKAIKQKSGYSGCGIDKVMSRICPASQVITMIGNENNICQSRYRALVLI